MAKACSPDMKDYQCEDDARNLMRAHEVMSDPKRHQNAVKRLDKMHAEKRQEATHAKAAKGLRAAFPTKGEESKKAEKKESGKKAEHSKVKAGLKKAFPGD